MKTWRRIRLAGFCGVCGDLLEKGTPVLELTRLGAWTKFRCAKCAGEPVPDTFDDDPAPVATSIRKQLAERLSSVRALADDWKHAQAGDHR